jgi:small GTP-binding protein
MALISPSIKFKITVVGGPSVGKTALLLAYSTHDILPEYLPPIYSLYEVKCDVHGREVTLALWDSAGADIDEWIRACAYEGTDVFLLCFPVSDPKSFATVTTKWLVELRHLVKDPAIMIVGTKKDLRTDEATLKRLAAAGEAFVTPADGQAMAAESKVVGYVECSARKRDGVDAVFELALRTAMAQRKRRSRCLLL